EDQLEHPLVPRALQRDAGRAEPVAEDPDPRAELRDDPRPVARELRREREAGRCLLSPAVELLFRRQAVAGRVQLDRREALRVVAEEALRVGPGRVEARLPRWVGAARGADDQ